MTRLMAIDPFWSDDHLTLYGGDCRAVLAEMPAESVHCVVTSPPYWGLRDYGTEGQLGLEPTPEAYVANMVDVFREVRRVLRDDGTLWLNLGDSYGSPTKHGGMSDSTGLRPYATKFGKAIDEDAKGTRKVQPGVKPKDLVGIPWRVAFALQADGWYLRSDIIWAKPNPMPESVTDRPTKAHEYLFLLSKSPRYYFDAEAVREAAVQGEAYHGGYSPMTATGPKRTTARNGRDGSDNTTSGRNLRTVWTIATEPYPGAHFATFPRKLVEPCVKAGTSERGVCPECGAPWVRVVEREADRTPVTARTPKAIAREQGRGEYPPNSEETGGVAGVVRITTTGWRASCDCIGCACESGCAGDRPQPVPATVLDPFAGSGTTLLVAQALGRKGIGIDLSPEYLEQAMRRNRQAPLGLVG